MASNYTNGHCWDHLDSEVVTKAADEISELQAELERLRSAIDGQAKSALETLRENVTLQSEMTKARELLARIMGKRDACMSSYWFDEIDAFLTHQSAPVAKEN